MKHVSVTELFEAGAHFGHSTRYWNPKMAPYIYGQSQGIHIINLNKTVVLLNQALARVYDIAKSGGKILFVGTKTFASDIIREEAQRAGMPYVDYRWLGGMLTNYKTIQESVKKLRNLEDQLANPEAMKKFTKKEGLNMTRLRDNLHRNFSGIKDMAGLPVALFIVDVHYEQIAIAEAHRLGMPVIAMVDTNSTPELVDYMIPANDDGSKSIRLIAGAMADVILEGREYSASVAKEKLQKQKLQEAKELVARTEKKEEPVKAAKVEKVDVAEKSTAPFAPKASKEAAAPKPLKEADVGENKVIKTKAVAKPPKPAEEKPAE